MSEARASQPSIARCVGQAVGIVWSAIRTPVTPQAVEVNRRTGTLEQGGMTLRRTTIDEVVVQPPPQTH
jgi:hypothetical protein